MNYDGIQLQVVILWYIIQ